MRLYGAKFASDRCEVLSIGGSPMGRGLDVIQDILLPPLGSHIAQNEHICPLQQQCQGIGISARDIVLHLRV